jgi:hypothetical protein
MTEFAEKVVCAWVNQISGITGTTCTFRPPVQGAFTIEQRSPVGAGAYTLVIRQQGSYSGWSPRPAVNSTSTTEVAGPPIAKPG